MVVYVNPPWANDYYIVKYLSLDSLLSLHRVGNLVWSSLIPEIIEFDHGCMYGTTTKTIDVHSHTAPCNASQERRLRPLKEPFFLIKSIPRYARSFPATGWYLDTADPLFVYCLQRRRHYLMPCQVRKQNLLGNLSKRFRFFAEFSRIRKIRKIRKGRWSRI